jgi:selenocysteine-specific elongation factor
MHVVGTAGHVDHGKSTLVRALTGIDPDRFEEEKRRGLTIDLGFAWCTLPSGREIGIVDVPGHERFIRNMLAGVGAIDAAIFVVAADEGWKPQSAEHLQILDFLEISGGVVALTKSDLVDADMLELVHEDAWKRLRGTHLHDAKIVPVSATTGAGLDELRAELDALLQATPEAPDLGRPRMFVDRSFTIAGAGTVVTGTLSGGALRIGDEVEVAPRGLRARIRSLQTHKQSVEEAKPGSRVAANLVGLERTEIARGDALVRPGQWIVTDSFVARIEAASDLLHPLTARGAYELFLGTSDFRCRLKFLEDANDTEAIVAANTPSGLAPAVRPGTTVLVQLFYSRALPVGVGDRFVLRDVGRRETVAGGTVIDQAGGTIRRGDQEHLKRLRRREGLTGPELATRIVAERGAVPREKLAALAGITDGNSSKPYIVDESYAMSLRQRILDLVAKYHADHPLEPGISVEGLRHVLDVDQALFEQILGNGDGNVVRDGAVIRLRAHGVALSVDQREEADRALASLRSSGASPPTLRDIGVGVELAKAMERLGEVEFVTPEIAYATDVWRDIEAKVARFIATNGPATVSQIRDAIGTSRKYAVPLLEKLDATGVTRRTGDLRELGPRGREIAEHPALD